MVLMRDLWNFSFFGRGGVSPTHSELSLCFGVIGKTPGPNSRNKFVNKIFVWIGHHDNVLARCDSIFPYSGVKECGTKHAHNFLFPKSSFRIWRTTVLGIFKGYAVILDAIQRSFLTKSATAAMFTSESILDGHICHCLLPFPFRLEIEITS
jgi:hypothetical protein